MTDVAAKLAELEARIEELEGRRHIDDSARGYIDYSGSVDLGGGPIDWTIRYSAAAVPQLPAQARVDVLAALGHPVRRALVETLLDGPRTGTELAEAVSLTSAGQLYHHIRALTSAKVIEQHTRGAYRIPAPKVVPLLVVMTAAADIGEALR
ncbi:winged helix-turn-helix transcriptional regulator [Nocardia cyriacigeorgica]|uniref:Winged helix-turn-helix transcriptional regulator n=1 Tax=Nocardia cyriacigeorgica TaxID=135487 RepID=A0A6P1CZL6_9NOCA|nr:helix-turn-helix domain-containing protein [Nocardia cyriacigeorgica]NEW38431.1 winged helix-turn-helix transcriptional regulator [Nocardia cyriacigeorgica]NEW43605.1 winged helix-turn-helix transcriptional regulator [Nocardia cyriacigeorgica]NEW49459.1 winged helix-turn-helix transcriptional regulator [Nocardia cyriacigeorgica]NEW54137.1 winged helix-turn-helix transcriptional regulator [Nocardia cyriacigeorgica]